MSVPGARPGGLGWCAVARRQERRAGAVGGSCGGGGDPAPATRPLPALRPAAPRGPGPSCPELCDAPAARGRRARFRLTSLCLEFAAASPDSQANFTVSGPARGGGWRRVPSCTWGKGAERMTGARARGVVGKGVRAGWVWTRMEAHGWEMPRGAVRVCRRGHVYGGGGWHWFPMCGDMLRACVLWRVRPSGPL